MGNDFGRVTVTVHRRNRIIHLSHGSDSFLTDFVLIVAKFLFLCPFDTGIHERLIVNELAVQ